MVIKNTVKFQFLSKIFKKVTKLLKNTCLYNKNKYFEL